MCESILPSCKSFLISTQAHTLSSIANCDWPEEYPDLLSSLIGLLSSNSSDSVHGAMQVLTEFIKSDLTEDQILPVLRELLPVLLSILGAAEVLMCAISLKFWSNTSLAATHGPHSRQNHISLSSMRSRAIHGQGSAPSVRQGSYRFCVTCVARGVQSFAQY